MRNPITAYLNWRRAAKLAAEEARITAVLAKHPDCSHAYIAVATGISLVSVDETLHRMREAGAVSSTWIEDDSEGWWPGHRQWRLADRQEHDNG